MSEERNMYFIFSDILFVFFIFVLILFFPNVIPLIITFLALYIFMHIFLIFYILMKDTKYIQDNGELISLSDMIENLDSYFIFKTFFSLSTLVYISFVSAHFDLMCTLIAFILASFLSSSIYKFKIRKIFK